MLQQARSQEESVVELCEGIGSIARVHYQCKFILIQEEISFHFSLDTLQPAFFELQMEDNSDNTKNTVLKPEGKTNFDDLKEINEIIPHKSDQLKFADFTFQPDFYHHTKIIPKSRLSGEE